MNGNNLIREDDPRLLLGLSYLRSGDIPLAEECCRALCVDSNIRKSPVLALFGSLISVSKDDIHGAKMLLEPFLGVRGPKHPEIFFQYGSLLFEERQFDRACFFFERAMNASEDDAFICQCILKMGVCNLYGSQFDSGVKRFRSLFSRACFVDVIGSAVRALLNFNQVVSAVSLASDAYRICSCHVSLVVYAGALIDSGNASSALNLLEVGSRGNFTPDELSEIAYLRGLAHEALDSTSQALLAYSEVRESSQVFHRSLYNSSLLLLRFGDFSGGLPLYRHRWMVPEFLSVAAHSLLRSVSSSPIRWNGLERCLFLSEQGVGETILFLRMLSLCPKSDARIKIALPPDLFSALRNNQAQFFCVDQFELLSFDSLSTQAGQDVYGLGDLLTIFADDLDSIIETGRYSVSSCATGLLKSRPKGRLVIGLCLNSYSVDFADLKSLTPHELLAIEPALLPDDDIEVVNLDHRLSDSDFFRLWSSLKFKVSNIHSSSSARDLDGLFKRILMCDKVVCVCCTVGHACGLLGVPATVYATKLARQKFWSWNHTNGDGRSVWYPSIRVEDVKKGG
jgi:tetratricopeptide (TPR) repeat protein